VIPRHYRVALLALWVGCFTACVATPQSVALREAYAAAQLRGASPPFTPVINLATVPFFPQEQYQCGPAALATVLQSAGVSIQPQALVAQVYVPARQGSLQVEMLATPRRYGVLSYEIPPRLESLLLELAAGRPVLVMQNLGLDILPQWHYAVAVGYDLEQNQLILRSGLIRDYRVALTTFERTWQRAGYWAYVVLRPGELPADDNADAYFQSLTAFESVAAPMLTLSAYAEGFGRWPTHELLGMGYGNLLYSQGEKDTAVQVYQTLLLHNPDSGAAHNNLAHVLLEQGDFDNALSHAQQAVALGGAFADVYRATLTRIRTVHAGSEDPDIDIIP
jgi:tetratricopeptide (TPR) repeat protein